MRLLTLFVAALVTSAMLGPVALAGVLTSGISIKLTGTYSQAPAGDESALAVTKPLKMADLKTLLGVPAATAVQIYFDRTATAFVLAPPGLAEGTDTTPTATIVTFGTSTYLNKSAKKGVDAGSATVINDLLTAGYTTNYTYAGKKVTSDSTYTAYGVLNGNDIVLRFRILDIFNRQQ